MKEVLTGSKRNLMFLVPFLIVLFFLLFLFGMKNYHQGKDVPAMVMGGRYYAAADSYNSGIRTQSEDTETYFRPSKLPVLNTRFDFQFFRDYMDKKTSEIVLPSSLFSTPEDTILNYFSILREAANLVKGKGAGCGTLGDSVIPYPAAYNFLTKSYQERLTYEQYLKTFENILHISLLKYHNVPLYENRDNILRYFIELETIEGNERNQGSFAYYYGFADLQKENGEYKISNLEFHGEDYLCAPYHGWAYDAEMSVQVRYGGWCDMIEKMYPTKQEGYIKNISFRGKDGKDYLIVFYQLTNDTDIEIAQYRRGETGEWELIKFNPEDCIKEENYMNFYEEKIWLCVD
ncbi:hypothetical protein SAMN02745217_01958 [Anaerocolumna xylanovorans DSM 12503]|uniref:Uncharacterized protein n=2 Tax=Anaerocolumna TaxID=1843210 RepID=A0A1M7Y7Q5_9FIRM|nr:hypothetical protein SAMN02745217_01958 [Anaerocolumna xylanovorans DSM 12503]